MRANKKHGLVFLGLLLIFSITVLASSNCPSKEEYRVRVKDATRDYLTSPGHEKLVQLQDMFKIYATHDFTKCLEAETQEGTGAVEVAGASVGVSQIILLVVGADKLLAEKALEDAKNTLVVNPRNQKRFELETFLAKEQLGKANGAASVEKYDLAVEHYKNSWEHSQQAIKIAKCKHTSWILCQLQKEN